MFIFTLLCGASESFMKAFKAFIKPFEAPQRSVKIKIEVNFFYLSGIGAGRVNVVSNLGVYIIDNKSGKGDVSNYDNDPSIISIMQHITDKN